MTQLLIWREAARTCTRFSNRIALLNAVDALEVAIKQFSAAPTVETMMAVNNCWAHAMRLYNILPPEGTPAPLSGSPEPARLAA
jgi:hypothetical protein